MSGSTAAPSRAERTDTGWQARIDGEIVALAVRRGAAGLIAVATEAGETHLFSTDGESIGRSRTAVELPTSIDIHPSRTSVVVTGVRGAALCAPDSGPVPLADDWCSSARFNASGDLAVATGRRVLTVPRGGGEGRLTDPLPSTVTDVAWFPGGRTVAAGAYAGVYQFDLEHRAPVVTHPYVGSHLAVTVDPNGRWVCSGNQDASVHIWRVADNDELQMSGYREKVSRLAFDPTGRWMANNGAPEVTIWDFSGKGPRGRSPRVLVGHARVVDIAWRPRAGGVLATVGSEGSARWWNITGMAAGGDRRARKVLAEQGARALRWVDDDRVAITADGGRLTVSASSAAPVTDGAR